MRVTNALRSVYVVSYSCQASDSAPRLAVQLLTETEVRASRVESSRLELQVARIDKFLSRKLLCCRPFAHSDLARRCAARP